MSMEKEISTPLTLKIDHLPLGILHRRMANELCELADICRDVESALGEIIDQPNKPLDQPIITLQGLDRLRQSLEDMVRLAKLLSQSQNACSPEYVSVKSIRASIVLAGLAERLTRSVATITSEADTEQDVIWG